MSFTRIKHDPITHIEVYSDGILDITIVHPQHHTSGFPCEVTVTEREEPYSPAEGNAKVEGEDVPPETPEAFEKL